jgi:hypothetical protein
VLERISTHVRGNAVGYLALFVALSGTAVASSLKLSANSVGTAQLKNGAVTGKKVAKNTLTGANIKASTLGTVPSATRAASATNTANATNAQNAAHATNAQNATNAAELGGQAPDSFQTRVSGTCGSGSAISSITAAGGVACQSTSVTQMMGGTKALAPTPTAQHLAAEGLTSTPGALTDASVGTSALAGTAGNLDVGIFTLQSNATTFTLDVNGGATAVSCTIPLNGGTCSDSTHAASIPAGALVDIAVTGSGPATQITFGWTDTTPG